MSRAQQDPEKAVGGEESGPWGQGPPGLNPSSATDQLCALGWLNVCISVSSWVKLGQNNTDLVGFCKGPELLQGYLESTNTLTDEDNRVGMGAEWSLPWVVSGCGGWAAEVGDPAF